MCNNHIEMTDDDDDGNQMLCSEWPCVFSDGSFLAVGSHDNFIYIYNVTESGRRYTRFGKCNVSQISYSCLNVTVCSFLRSVYSCGCSALTTAHVLTSSM